MKIKKKMPKTGQFIAVWEHNDVLWSQTHMYEENGVTWYSMQDDEFINPESPRDLKAFYKEHDTIFLVVK